METVDSDRTAHIRAGRLALTCLGLVLSGMRLLLIFMLTLCRRPYLAIEQLDRITGWRCRYRDWEAAVEWRPLSKESTLPVPYVNGTWLKGIQFQGNMCKKIALQVLSRVLDKS